MTEEIQVKRGRGRPRKDPNAPPAPPKKQPVMVAEGAKRRGRPPKNTSEAPSVLKRNPPAKKHTSGVITEAVVPMKSEITPQIMGDFAATFDLVVTTLAAQMLEDAAAEIAKRYKLKF